MKQCHCIHFDNISPSWPIRSKVTNLCTLQLTSHDYKRSHLQIFAIIIFVYNWPLNSCCPFVLSQERSYLEDVSSDFLSSDEAFLKTHWIKPIREIFYEYQTLMAKQDKIKVFPPDPSFLTLSHFLVVSFLFVFAFAAMESGQQICKNWNVIFVLTSYYIERCPKI